LDIKFSKIIRNLHDKIDTNSQYTQRNFIAAYSRSFSTSLSTFSIMATAKNGARDKV
jgi:hypothetical protein